MAVPKERRKGIRMRLSLPVQVQGHDADGPWEEMTQSEDASDGGACLPLRHPVLTGHALYLSLPLPKRFRRHDLTEASYRVYGLVRVVGPPLQAGGGPRVGVMFLGKQPPKGYEKNPGGRYFLPTDPKPSRAERRQFRRLEMFLNFRLQRTDGGAGGQEEQTVAENLCKGGARLLTSLPLAKGEIVLLEELGGSFRTRAEIRNVYIGQDRIPRLNLHFLDGEAPDRLVSVR